MITAKRTRLVGLDQQGSVQCVYAGRLQVLVDPLTLLGDDIAAVRIHGQVFVPCTDFELLERLNQEWNSGKPADDLRPIQGAMLLQCGAIVIQ